MSDLSPSPAPSNPPAEPDAKPGGRRRLWILIAILVLVVVALYYDRQFARPASQAAHELVMARHQQDLNQPGNAGATSDDIQALLHKRPSRRADHDFYTVETYRWRRGFVLLTYDVHVVYYKQGDGRFTLYHATLNAAPSQEQLPGGPVQPRILTEEERAAMAAAPAGPSAGPPGGPPSGPPSGSPSPSGPPGGPSAEPPGDPGEPAQKSPAGKEDSGK